MTVRLAPVAKEKALSFLVRTLSFPVRIMEKVPALAWIIRALSSSVGQKLVMAITGLMLCGFLVAHLGGNVFLFVGEEAYNDYAHALHKNEWLLKIAEVGLVALFFTHLGLAISTSNMNKQARKDEYLEQNSKQGMTILKGGGASSFMFATGAVVLGFVILHLIDFTFKGRGLVYPESEFEKARMLLSNPISAIIYVIGCSALAIHLVHGFGSALTTLGFSHPKYNKLVRVASLVFGWSIGLGFISFVIWSFASTK